MTPRPKTSKHKPQIKPKPASISKYAKILGKLGGRPSKKDTNVNYLLHRINTNHGLLG